MYTWLYTKQKMNRKNRILTMLACLNCVHTTHAVESTPVATDNTVQEDLKTLKRQYAVQAVFLGLLENSGDCTAVKDAMVKQAEIRSKMTKQMARLHMHDPNVQMVVRILSEMPEEIKKEPIEHFKECFSSVCRTQFVTTRFNKKMEAVYGTKGTCDVNYYGPHGKTLYEEYPFLMPKFDNDDRHLMSCHIYSNLRLLDKVIKKLHTTDPDIEKQVEDMYIKAWERKINRDIVAANEQKMPLAPWIERFLSDTAQDIGKLRKTIILHQMDDNLTGGDPIRKDATLDLLRKSQSIKEMVLNRMYADEVQAKMALIMIMKNKKKVTSEAVKKLTQNVLLFCAKDLDWGESNAIHQSIIEGEDMLNSASHSEVDHSDYDERASETSFQPLINSEEGNPSNDESASETSFQPLINSEDGNPSNDESASETSFQPLINSEEGNPSNDDSASETSFQPLINSEDGNPSNDDSASESSFDYGRLTPPQLSSDDD
jgi:hypothetical protein